MLHYGTASHSGCSKSEKEGEKKLTLSGEKTEMQLHRDTGTESLNPIPTERAADFKAAQFTHLSVDFCCAVTEPIKRVN